MRAAAFVATSAVLACAALAWAEDNRKDAEQLRGQWTAVTAFDADGKSREIKEDDRNHFTFEFGVDTITTKLKTRALEGKYKLDSSKSPREIDIVRKRKDQELTFQGIYAIEGDRLKVCLAGAGHPRPKKFRSGEGIEFAVELKRVKP